MRKWIIGLLGSIITGLIVWMLIEYSPIPNPFSKPDIKILYFQVKEQGDWTEIPRTFEAESEWYNKGNSSADGCYSSFEIYKNAHPRWRERSIFSRSNEKWEYYTASGNDHYNLPPKGSRRTRKIIILDRKGNYQIGAYLLCDNTESFRVIESDREEVWVGK